MYNVKKSDNIKYCLTSLHCEFLQRQQLSHDVKKKQTKPQNSLSVILFHLTPNDTKSDDMEASCFFFLSLLLAMRLQSPLQVPRTLMWHFAAEHVEKQKRNPKTGCN